MVASEFPPASGGIGYYVYNLSRKLFERGHTVTVITRGSLQETRNHVIDGVNVLRVPFFPLYPFHVFLLSVSVNRQFKSLEPEFNIVHLHTPMPLFVRTSLPLITTVHTPMKIDARYHEVINLYSLAEKAQSLTVYPCAESRAFKASNKITSVSSTVAHELEEYGLNPDEITVVHNGVDEKAFVPGRERRSSERYILYTGVLRARKGLFDLLQCASCVCKVHNDVSFAICGKGPFLNKLKEKARKMNLQDKVAFLGYVERSRLIQLYQEAEIQAIPSHYEGMPTVLLEAMSCGLPVVATDVGGNKEVILPGANGFLVPPRSPEKMAKIISRLLDDPLLREKVGRAARKTVLNNFTWDKIADNVIKCYEDILKGHTH